MKEATTPLEKMKQDVVLADNSGTVTTTRGREKLCLPTAQFDLQTTMGRFGKLFTTDTGWPGKLSALVIWR